ncbi:MAG: hypothetical protein ACRD4H_00470 [Candidatus Acidiferrales bacterium]
MRFISSPRFLVIYSCVLTVVFMATILSGFAQNERKNSFDQIDVQRINIVGPDGKNQLVISNRQEIPEAIIDGKTFQSHGRHDGAGLIFYNSEGDEDGGLAFESKKTTDGYAAGGDLMFDQHKQDQIVGIEYSDDNGKRKAGLHVWDRPDADLAEQAERVETIRNMPAGTEKDTAMKKLQEEAKTGAFGATRVFVGKTQDKNATVLLCDARGNPRLTLKVTPSGAAEIDFLDENGNVTRRVPEKQDK